MTKDQRREAMPECTAFVDEARSVFGDVKILYASENGHEWGEKQPEGTPLSERWE